MSLRCPRSISVLVPLLAIVVLAGCGSYAVVQQTGYQFDKTGELRTRTASEALSESVTVLDLDHKFGTVRVEVAPGPPRYDWSLKVWGRTVEDADLYVEQVALVRTTEGDTERLRLDFPESPGERLRGIESELMVWVPADTRLELRNQFGSVALRGLAGEVRGDCGHTSVELAELSGPVFWRTTFGSLTATRIGGGELYNSHGELLVEGVKGDLVAKTSFATATLQGIEGRLEVENSHGALTVGAVEGPLVAETSFAELDVTNVAGDVVLRNSHGGIRARAIGGALSARSNFGEIDLEAVGPRIEVENSHGAVRLVLLPAAQDRPPLEWVRAGTTFGDLTLRLPAGLRPAISVDEANGAVESAFPIHTSESAARTAAESSKVHLKIRQGTVRIEESAAPKSL